MRKRACGFLAWPNNTQIVWSARQCSIAQRKRAMLQTAYTNKRCEKTHTVCVCVCVAKQSSNRRRVLWRNIKSATSGLGRSGQKFPVSTVPLYLTGVCVCVFDRIQVIILMLIFMCSKVGLPSCQAPLYPTSLWLQTHTHTQTHFRARCRRTISGSWWSWPDVHTHTPVGYIKGVTNWHESHIFYLRTLTCNRQRTS